MILSLYAYAIWYAVPPVPLLTTRNICLVPNSGGRSNPLYTPTNPRVLQNTSSSIRPVLTFSAALVKESCHYVWSNLHV